MFRTAAPYRSSVFIVTILVLLSGLNGCMTLEFSAKNSIVPVLLNAPAENEYIVVEHFSVLQDRSMLFLKRLHGGGHPDVNAMLASQLKKTPGDAIINLTIKGETRETDVIAPVVLGIAGSFVFTPFIILAFEPLFADLKSYSLEGDVIRYIGKDGRIHDSLRIDPDSGLPVKRTAPIEFDPETGLPKK